MIPDIDYLKTCQRAEWSMAAGEKAIGVGIDDFVDVLENHCHKAFREAYEVTDTPAFGAWCERNGIDASAPETWPRHVGYRYLVDKQNILSVRLWDEDEYDVLLVLRSDS